MRLSIAFILAAAILSPCIAAADQAPFAGDADAQIGAARDAFVATCKGAMRSHQGRFQQTSSWQRFGRALAADTGLGLSPPITSFEQAVAIRKSALRVAQDPVQREIDLTGRSIQQTDAAIGRITFRSAMGDAQKADWLADKECLVGYLNYLHIIQEPSLLAMRNELSAESTARINSTIAQQQASQNAAEEQQNEVARQRKEADIAAALADEQALKHKREVEAQVRAAAEELPSCSGSEAIQSIKDKFELGDHPLKDIQSARNDEPPIGGTVLDPERHCLARVISGTPPIDIRYTLRWRDDKHTTILLTLTPQP